MVTPKQVGIVGSLLVAGAVGYDYIKKRIYGPPRRAEYAQLQEDNQGLKAYKEYITKRAAEVARDKELLVPSPFTTLNVFGEPRPEREVNLSWGKFLYKGEAIKFNLVDDKGRVYDLTVINKCKMRQDDFIDSWLALLSGGYSIRIEGGAKYHTRCDKQMARGWLPHPVSAIYEKDPDTGVEKSMKILIDDPGYVDFVPILPGDKHYPATAVEFGCEVAGRLQCNPTDENKALAERFIRKFSNQMSGIEIQILKDTAAVTAKIRQDTLQRIDDTYRRRLEQSEQVLMNDCID